MMIPARIQRHWTQASSSLPEMTAAEIPDIAQYILYILYILYIQYILYVDNRQSIGNIAFYTIGNT